MSTSDSDVHMQLDSQEAREAVNPSKHEDLDEYSDFADDPEALEIIDQLLLEAATQQNQEADAPLQVTDIEDYEEPRGVYLPKVRGFERTRQEEFPSQHLGTQPQQVVRDEGGEYRNHLYCFCH